MEPKNIAIVCQGGGSHAAYAAGALNILLQEFEQGPEEKQELRLTGLSGTSGGAICAMLAWYGTLKGGSAHAEQLLDDFWQSNCAIYPAERIWNDSAIQSMDALNCEILFSPYEWPASASLSMLTGMWPAYATWINQLTWNAWTWMRGEFFQLDELIKPHMNFKLAQALGSYCSIPFDIERWNIANLELSMYGNAASAAARMKYLEQKIQTGLYMPKRIRQLMDTDAFPVQAPLRKALEGCPESVADFKADTLKKLSKQVRQVMTRIPQLLLGAVDVGNGEFTAFSSERAVDENGISLPAVLASAALPWLFQAVAIDKTTPDGRIESQQFWDGLFSQNPPIKNFISNKDNNRKPDEIWVIQINPSDCDLKTLKNDIWDRRNELSGNLSLNQEVDFISAINKRIDLASSAGQSYPAGEGSTADKHVHVHRILMDGASIEEKTGKTLGSLSKGDRDLKLMQALREDGRKQAGNFLRTRAAMQEACANLDSPIYASISEHSLATLNALKNLGALAQSTTAAKQGGVRLTIDETTMPLVSKKDDVYAIGQYRALARWHTQGILNRTTHVHLEGETLFTHGGDAPSVCEMRITCIEQLDDLKSRNPVQAKPRRLPAIHGGRRTADPSQRPQK